MQWTEIPRDKMAIPGEGVNHGATPYFRHENIFNEPQSRIHNRPVYDLKEVVEIRFAANPQYKPVFGVDEMESTDPNGQVITWAERYSKQYQAFVAGAAQEADGTPLEELIPYGISQAQLSICRALSIYSIEALHHLEGVGIKRLGVHGNDLKPMAKRYMENRASGSQQQSEINELKRQLAALRGETQEGLGEEIFVSTELQAVDPFLPAELSEELSPEAMKAQIKELTGQAPRGTPSIDTLKMMLEQAKAA